MTTVVGESLRAVRRAWADARHAVATALFHGGWRRREPWPSRPLVVVAAAVAVGTILPRIVAIHPPAAWSVGLAALLAWCHARRRWSAAAAIALVAAVAGGAAAWSAARHRWFDARDLAWSLGDEPLPVVVEGCVTVAPQVVVAPRDPLRGGGRPPTRECVVAIGRARDDDVWRPRGGLALVALDDAAPPLLPGDTVRVWGRASRPAPPGNPGEFDRRAGAREERCLSLIRCSGPGAVEVLAHGPGWAPTRLLARLRAAGAAALRTHVSEARGALAAALVLGTRGEMPPEASESFMVTGTVHILSISGLHVALLAAGLFAVFRAARIPHGGTLAAVAFATGVYMLLVGAETPVLRATILVWIGCLGSALGRRSGGFTALAAAAIAVMLWHPAGLLRAGTQLSFLSTAVIVAVAGEMAARARVDDPLERLIDRARHPLERRGRRWLATLRDALLLGAAVWLATAPIVAARFHLVSPVGLILNPLVAPLVGLAMVGGFACLVAAPVWVPAAGAAGFVCDAALGLVETAVRGGGLLPGAFAWVPGPPAWWVVGWYVAMVSMAFLVAGDRLRRASTWGLAAAAWCLAGIVVAAVLPAAPRAGLETCAAAMGHGLGVVVRAPSGRVLVYDAGRLGSGSAAGRGLSSLLWSMGVSRVETLVISHADTDHFNGVPDLVERFAVARVVVPRHFLESHAPAVAELLRVVAAAGVPVATAEGGDELPFDPAVTVRVLHPPPASAAPVEPPRSDNESSLVLGIEADGRRVLLTGDLEGAALERFVASSPGRCDVLVAPHHGSAAILPQGLLEATMPSWVIVSGAGGPRYAAVERAWATAISPAPRVLRTAGAVRVRLGQDGSATDQFLDGRWRPVAGTGRGRSRQPVDAVEVHEPPRPARVGEHDPHVVATGTRLPGSDPLRELLPLAVDLHRHRGEQRSVGSVEMHLDRAAGAGRRHPQRHTADTVERHRRETDGVAVIDGAEEAAAAGVPGGEHVRSADLVGGLRLGHARAEVDRGARGERGDLPRPAVEVGRFDTEHRPRRRLVGRHRNRPGEAGEETRQARRLERIDPGHHLPDLLGGVVRVRDHGDFPPHAAGSLQDPLDRRLERVRAAAVLRGHLDELRPHARLVDRVAVEAVAALHPGEARGIGGRGAGHDA